MIAAPLVLAALIDAGPAAPSSSAPTATTADALYAAARRARSDSAYARYAVYATVVSFRHGNQRVVSTWDTVEDVRRRLVHAHAIEREEAAHPHVPHGINIGVGGFGPSGIQPPGAMPPRGHAVNHEPTDDPIGQVSFAVDQDFGLALNAPPIAATTNMSEVASSITALPHIGRTGTIARTYDVTDLGDVVENGVTLHHLGLRPLRDPRRYRLRELWLDTKTSLPLRAIVAGIGNRWPLDAVSWRVDFRQVEGGTYLARETALQSVDLDGKRLDDLTITFDELRPTNRLTATESLGLSAEVGITDP